MGPMQRMGTPQLRVANRRERAYEAIAFASVMVLALAVRLWRLGTFPETITADEADNLQSAWAVLEGTGPSIFGFDWKPSPAFSIHGLSWSIRVFGDSVTGFRMYPVVLSMLTIGFFWLVARRAMTLAATTIAAALLATNLGFLHFSRTAWENMNSALFAIAACWLVQKAVEAPADRKGRRWWAALGVATALGLYGYFTGWFIFVAVTLAVMIALVSRRIGPRNAFIGLSVTAGVAAILYFPLARNILGDWALFTRRTSLVSVFEVEQAGNEYLGDGNAWTIAAKNVWRTFDGFIINDGKEFTRGLWGRYNPEATAPLSLVARILFWCGLITAAVMRNRSWSWWPFMVPLFIAQVFSTGTPDLARGVYFVPFYFLFIGLFLSEIQRSVATRWRPLMVAAAVAIGALIAVHSVRSYIEWQEIPGAQMVRLPGVAACEYELFSDLGREAAAAGGLVNGEEFDRLRREALCSPAVSAWMGDG